MCSSFLGPFPGLADLAEWLGFPLSSFPPFHWGQSSFLLSFLYFTKKRKKEESKGRREERRNIPTAIFLSFWSFCPFCPRTRGWQDTHWWGRQEQGCFSNTELWNICKREGWREVFLFLLVLISVLFSYYFSALLSTLLSVLAFTVTSVLTHGSHGPWLAAPGSPPAHNFFGLAWKFFTNTTFSVLSIWQKLTTQSVSWLMSLWSHSLLSLSWLGIVLLKYYLGIF